jgi:outer membrane protein OmpA-like peptidoglycan-associated protein
VRQVSQDDAMLFRVAAAWNVPAFPKLDLTGELLGETALGDPFSAPAENPMEVMFGGLYKIAIGWTLSAAAGTGLTPGVGTPVARFVSCVRWTPQSEAGPFAAAVVPAGSLARLSGGRINLKENVHFMPGSDTLQPYSHGLLNAVAKILLENPDVRVLIVGHTDETGTPEKNQTLSEQRAVSVKRYLVSRGVAAKRMETEGRGQYEPIADNTTAEGREKNRRVEFLLK